ncbi:hypothetical protein PV05_07218 [Exophiala xenobiotica]|uniref:Uncharacterized protein n=1 Tax=Exophiala xenobiotica TaxID=348802 RepID=A0A0D2CXJ1_9EURO|nr:uncharacterized protein PV05_07218 [Exophiala xenobiotica]KIW54887.1 hypothetical protein PV05_07218 [Exophiala xenobiotica]
MAPIPSKRSRPPFSPPRPGKSKPTKSPKTQSATGSKKSTKTSGGSRVQKKTSTKRPRQKKVSRGAAGTARAFLEEEAGDDDEEDEVDEEPEVVDRDSTGDEEEEQDENHDSDDESGNDEQQGDEEPESSPEPDFMLAEVTHSGDHTSDMLSSEPAITLPLIHRIMHTQFNDPEKTKIKPDAKVLVGKYIEIFVKEGIRRCVDEKKEHEKSGGGGAHVDSGWLELEDLERVATQLCMDF